MTNRKPQQKTAGQKQSRKQVSLSDRMQRALVEVMSDQKLTGQQLCNLFACLWSQSDPHGRDQFAMKVVTGLRAKGYQRRGEYGEYVCRAVVEPGAFGDLAVLLDQLRGHRMWPSDLAFTAKASALVDMEAKLPKQSRPDRALVARVQALRREGKTFEQIDADLGKSVGTSSQLLYRHKRRNTRPIPPKLARGTT
jgi:hypothetical protein